MRQTSSMKWNQLTITMTTTSSQQPTQSLRRRLSGPMKIGLAAAAIAAVLVIIGIIRGNVSLNLMDRHQVAAICLSFWTESTIPYFTLLRLVT